MPPLRSRTSMCSHGGESRSNAPGRACHANASSAGTGRRLWRSTTRKGDGIVAVSPYIPGHMLILLLLSLILGNPLARDCEIRRIVDGDTFYCADGRKVRLIGIDSPELSQGEPGRDARDALQSLIRLGPSVG